MEGKNKENNNSIIYQNPFSLQMFKLEDKNKMITQEILDPSNSTFNSQKQNRIQNIEPIGKLTFNDIDDS